MDVTLQVDLWKLFALIGSVIGAFWVLAKMLLQQTKAGIDEKFETLSQHMSQQDLTARRLERDLMELRAELPRDYVRREDHTRVIATVQVTIDNLRLTIERFMLEGRK